MRIVRYLFTALVVLALGGHRVAARTFTNADVSGGYVLSFGSHGYDDYDDRNRYIGVLVTDGAGIVTGGTRTAFRYEGSDYSIMATYVQSASGTYEVHPDGTGTMHVRWTPTLPSVPYNGGTFPGWVLSQAVS